MEEQDLRTVEGTIFAIDETATHDGPGLRMMVYLKGCPLRCEWCHSPESVSPKPEVVWYGQRCEECGACVDECPQGLRSFDPMANAEMDRSACLRCGKCVDACQHEALEMKGYTATAGEIADRANRLQPFFTRSGGGITLTGGEPMLQYGFAYAVMSLCRSLGIHTAMETTGMTTWDRLGHLAWVTDLFLYDLKHSDESAHQELTGGRLEVICANLTRLRALGADVIVRVPVIPGYNGSPDNIRGIARRARDAGVKKITLLPFNPSASGKYAWLQRGYPLDGVTRQSDDEMATLEALAEEEGLTVVPA